MDNRSKAHRQFAGDPCAVWDILTTFPSLDLENLSPTFNLLPFRLVHLLLAPIFYAWWQRSFIRNFCANRRRFFAVEAAVYSLTLTFAKSTGIRQAPPLEIHRLQHASQTCDQHGLLGRG